MDLNVAISYKGSALDAGQMDVYIASSSMIAFTEFIVEASKCTYGDNAKTKANVSGFEQGSFVTHLTVSVGFAATLFTTIDAGALWATVKQALDLWIHLQGEPPTQILNQSNNQVAVTNNKGTVLQINASALNLVLNEKSTTAVQAFIADILSKDGFDTCQIIPGKGSVIAPIKKADAAYFKNVSSERILLDHTTIISVTVISPSFEGANKWRVSDGDGSFAVALLDEVFMLDIAQGRRFGMGDILVVDMRIVQTLIAGKIKLERTVTKVHQHITKAEQLTLL